jgi:amino acid adenylation domain-containing protein
MNKDIAVIGMAGRFPEAVNIHQFYENLRNGRDSVTRISRERIRATNIPDVDYRILGFLEDIDKFDHKFFNVSKVEAQYMDPNQKIALEVVYEAMENAGYDPDHFKGSRTAVIVGNVDYHYSRMLEGHFDPTMFSGNTHFTTAGRIARQFDLRGSGAIVDTGCSSALVAVHMACREILSGDADYAIACGHKLILFPAESRENVLDDVGITSKDGKTRSFAADSNGSGGSETIACVLLKPLEKALEDNDIIYAVIKGSSVNQNGQLSGSITATSSVAQANLIKDAWKKAAIDPLTVSYIEAHGSGTQLGDPIEIGGINLAFKDLTDKKRFCAVSCVKSNIGHADTASGIAGFIKAVLSLKHKELFPSLHFDKPNPFIDFENSAAYINTALKEWNPECGVRRAGVSSFGFAGNNAHFVLEEAPAVPQGVAGQGPWVVTVSSRRENGVSANMKAISDFIRTKPQYGIQDISFTLNAGRKHFPYRFAVVVSSVAELLEAFDRELQSGKAYRAGDDITPSDTNAGYRRFVFQYGFYRMLESCGLVTPDLLGLGTGDLVVSVISGDMEMGEAIKEACAMGPVEVENLNTRLSELVERESAMGKVAFIEMGPEGLFSRGLKALPVPDGESLFQVFVPSQEPGLAYLFRDLYLAGCTIDWSTWHKAEGGRRIELPGYQFEKIRCWIKEPTEESAMSGVLLPDQRPEARLQQLQKPAELSSAPSTDVYINEAWTETEKKVAAIWIEVLKLDKVDLHDDFFTLGGHSLFAAQVSNRIEKELRVKLDFKNIFTFSTIKLLAQGVDMMRQQHGIRQDYVEITPAAPAEFYPLSYSQRRLWMVDQLEEKGNLAYNLPAAFLIEGEIDRQRFENIFSQLIARQEAFRTSFVMHDGEPVQVVSPEVSFRINYISCTEEALRRTVESLIYPFDLSRAPLFRLSLISVSPVRHIMFFDMHHIISDGFSGSIMVNEFVSLFTGNPLPELTVQYKDYAVWQNSRFAGEGMKADEQFWLDTFKGEIPVLNLPLDYPRPAMQSFEGDKLNFVIGKDLTFRLREMVQASGTTLYMVLLSAYNVLLAKYSGQDDIVVGTPVAGRSQPEVESIIGVFINTLAMRNFPSSGKSFSSFLKELKENSLRAYEHQEYPFEALVSSLGLKRDMSRNPLFDVMFLFHHFDKSHAKTRLEGLSFGTYEFEKNTSQFDLTLEVQEGEHGLAMKLEYCRKLFSRATMERFRSHFIRVLEAVLENPEIKIGDIDLTSEDEKSRILSEFNNTEIAYPRELMIHQLLERRVKEAPDSPALTFGDGDITCSELNKRANQLARGLRKRGCGPGSVVAVLADRSPGMLTGIYAVLKTGAAYLPIDPSYPADRIRFILEDSNALILLSDRDFTFGGAVINLNDEANFRGDDTDPDPAGTSSDLAYIIYTSGSTGQPKGVMIEHHSVINRLAWMQRTYPLTKTDKVLQKTPFTFDVSVWELFWWTFSDASVCLLPPGGEKDPAVVAAWIEEKGITTLHFVPSMLTAFLDYVEDHNAASRLRSLKLVFSSGEALSAQQAERFFKVLGAGTEARLINLYGPTEATVDVSYFECSRQISSSIVPIGKPVDNTRLYILNEGRIQPVGLPGELCIAGAGLARGYLNRPELTAEKFIAAPWEPKERLYRTGDLARWLPDGNICFLGRTDHQVKIRGYRIETEEIANVMLRFPGITSAVVLAQGKEDPYLAAYYVSSGEIGHRDLKEFIGSLLPEYMIPSAFLRIEEMPLSPNGKLNRTALPETGLVRDLEEAFVAPEGGTEEYIASVWSEILGMERISALSNFFELGGHSLKATRLISRIYKDRGTELNLREIFAQPVLRELAAAVDRKKKGAYEPIPLVPDAEYYGLSHAQKRLWLTDRMADGKDVTYNMPSAYRIEGSLDVSALRKAFSVLIERHESLRTSFHSINGVPKQKIHPNTNFRVTEVSLKEDRDKEEKLGLMLAAEPAKAFNLQEPGLIRATLVETGEESHVLMITMHHIISDAWSTEKLIGEIVALYTAYTEDKEASLPVLPIQYKDYAAWHNDMLAGEEGRAHRQYWHGRLSGQLPVLNLPSDFPRPALKTFNGSIFSFRLNDEVVRQLESISRKQGASFFMTLFASVTGLLHRSTGQEDMVLGFPLAGRNHPDLEDQIGFYVNTLPLRVSLNRKNTFEELLVNIRQVCLEAAEHQLYPFDMLVEELCQERDMSRSPLFDAGFTWNDMWGLFGDQPGSPEAITVSSVEQPAVSAKYDLWFYAGRNPKGVFFTIEYNTDLFRRETIEAMAWQLQSFMEQAGANGGGIRLMDLDLGVEPVRGEQNDIIIDFNF